MKMVNGKPELEASDLTKLRQHKIDKALNNILSMSQALRKVGLRDAARAIYTDVKGIQERIELINTNSSQTEIDEYTYNPSTLELVLE